MTLPRPGESYHRDGRDGTRPGGAGRHRPRRRRWVVVAAALATGSVLAGGVAALGAGGQRDAVARVGALPVAPESPSPVPAGTSAAPSRAVPRPAHPTRTPASRAGRSTPRPPAPAGTPTTWPEAQVLALVNEQRAKAGCAALTGDPRLAAAARGHSADMAARGYFDHSTPEGVDPGTRITRAGYAWSAYGENIAMGQPDAASVMTAWMNSSGHRANILNCGFRDLGVGLAYDAGHRPYWTQDFGTPR